MIAKDVDGQHHQRQQKTGEQDDPGRDLKKLPPRGHDIAPAGNIGRRADPQKAERRFAEHRRGADEGGLHGQRPDSIGNDVLDQNLGR